ncbi:MAG: hypothetical protein ACYDEA_00445 [Candidatus Dormibacteria bacterium]
MPVDRMRERQVPEGAGETVPADRHASYPGREGNLIVIGDPGGRRAIVVVAKDSSPPRIITAAD